MADWWDKILRRLFPPIFTVEIRGANATCKQGKVTSKVLREFTALAREGGVSSGTIYGILDENGDVVLDFTAEFPERTRQRVRNAWVVLQSTS